MIYSIHIKEENMKLLIAGSRTIKDFDLSPYITDDVDTILTSGAKGIDTIAEQYAKEHGLDLVVIKPQYDLYGKGAPIVRNKTLAENCDKALIIWDGTSKGTKFTADYVQKLGKPLSLITYNAE
jgi:hypothetical protein